MIWLLLLLQEAPKGHLLIAGGGRVTAPMIERAFALAGGKDAPILVIPQASDGAEAGEDGAKLWRGAGASRVSILDLKDGPVAAVEAARLIWIGGGQQSTLMDRLKGTGVPEAIRKRYRQGAVVAGTSAGAAVMSSEMITGKADLKAVRSGRTELVEGLGLWPEAIVDQHFHARQRFNRLLSAVLDRPKLVGVGIDEDTAVVVSGAVFEVIGDGGVTVLDARTARPAEAAADQP